MLADYAYSAAHFNWFNDLFAVPLWNLACIAQSSISACPFVWFDLRHILYYNIIWTRFTCLSIYCGTSFCCLKNWRETFSFEITCFVVHIARAHVIFNLRHLVVEGRSKTFIVDNLTNLWNAVLDQITNCTPKDEHNQWNPFFRSTRVNV